MNDFLYLRYPELLDSLYKSIQTQYGHGKIKAALLYMINKYNEEYEDKINVGDS